MESETKQYCVTVKIYTWADDAEQAIVNVMSDLDYLCKSESSVNGYIHPKITDVEFDPLP